MEVTSSQSGHETEEVTEIAIVTVDMAATTTRGSVNTLATTTATREDEGIEI